MDFSFFRVFFSYAMLFFMKNKKSIELLAPIGSFACLHAAIQAKADSIYFGIGPFHMRKAATEEFSLKDLRTIVSICKKNKIRSYVTVNSIIYNQELSKMKKLCDQLKKAKVDAIIASDFSVISYANSIGLSVHGSTQLNISNMDAVKFFASYCDTIVLARELSSEEVKKICQTIQKEKILGTSGHLLKVEVFIHGALCMAIAGRCFLSHSLYQASANRGECVQVCRRSFQIADEETKKSLKLENPYILSPKDLSTLPCLDEIVNLGVSIFKIEGRGRSADYVFKVVKVYREALDAILKKSFTKEKITGWQEELKSVYNRGFWEGGYFLGKASEKWSLSPHSQATEEKVYVGKIQNYFSKIRVAELKVEAYPLALGDEYFIIGPTTGLVQGKIVNIEHSQDKNRAKKGEIISFELREKVRKNDKLYLVKKRAF